MSKTLIILTSGSADSLRADDADTLEEANELAGLARELGWDVELISYEQPRETLIRILKTTSPDAIINLVQTVDGSDADIHAATALLDELGIAYTGNGTHALRQIATKPDMKAVLEQAGIPTAGWFSEETASLAAAGRYLVKSESEHCSLGIDASSIVEASGILATIAQRKARFGGRWFAESYLDGREFNVSLIADGKGGVENMPVAELSFAELPEGIAPIVDYAGKWDEDAPSFVHLHRVFPAADGVDGALVQDLARLAHATWQACGLKGYARVDFRTDHAGRPYVIDINANPCLNIGVGVMAAAEQAGLTPAQVLARILDDALIPSFARAEPQHP